MIEFCTNAIIDGNMRLIESCYEPGDKEADSVISEYAAKNGKLNYLTWLYENGCKMGIREFNIAIKYGPHLECAHYLASEVLGSLYQNHTTLDELSACMQINVPDFETDVFETLICTLECRIESVNNSGETDINAINLVSALGIDVEHPYATQLIYSIAQNSGIGMSYSNIAHRWLMAKIKYLKNNNDNKQIYS